jgi:metal-responsive CopG/Arc/MetJ family transcriptional regulator
MHLIFQLEKQQVGLRLPKYLVEEIDAFTNQFSVNRTDEITEAISSYISEQKANIFYSDFDTTSS